MQPTMKTREILLFMKANTRTWSRVSLNLVGIVEFYFYYCLLAIKSLTVPPLDLVHRNLNRNIPDQAFEIVV